MTIYCKNQNCPLENRICCNKCSQQYHKHEITDINDLKIDIDNAASKLVKVIDEFKGKIQQITTQANAIIKKIQADLDELLELSRNFQNQTKNQLLKGVTQSNEIRIKGIIESSILKQQQIFETIIEKPPPIVPPPPPVNPKLQMLVQKYEQAVKTKRIEDILKCLDEILLLEPNNKEFKNERTRLIQHQLTNKINQANSLFEQGYYQEALNIYLHAIDQNVHNFKVYYQAGICLTNLEQYQEAIKCFNLSLMIDESHHDSLYQLSQLLYGTKEIDNLRTCHQNMKLHKHPKQQLVEVNIHFYLGLIMFTHQRL